MEKIGMMIRVALLTVALLLSGCDDDQPVRPEGLDLTFAFETSREGFELNMADYPVGSDQSLNAQTAHQALPDTMGTGNWGLYLRANNISDDLFMYVTRRLNQQDGITPGASYAVTGLRVRIATTAGAGCVGAGGAPGESVYLKAGVTATEPQRLEVDGDWRLNIDKGDQATGGPDAAVLGHIGSDSLGCGTADWAFKTLELAQQTTVTSDSLGRLWLLVGLDSGFEGVTEIYFDELQLQLTENTTGDGSLLLR